MAHKVGPGRSLTVTWQDSAETAAAAGRESGIDTLRRLQAGELAPPPVGDLVGLQLDHVEPGRVVFSLVPGEYHYNPLGGVHGGIIATLLDSAVGCAVHSALPAGRGYTTLELKVNYLRAANVKTGRIRAEGTAIHVGRRSAVAEGRVLDESGKLIATCSTTCLVFEVPTGA